MEADQEEVPKTPATVHLINTLTECTPKMNVLLIEMAYISIVAPMVFLQSNLIILPTVGFMCNLATPKEDVQILPNGRHTIITT